MPPMVTVSMNASTHLAHGNADVILAINHVKMTSSRVNQYVLLHARTTEYVLLLIPANVHPVTLDLNVQVSSLFFHHFCYRLQKKIIES